MRGRQTDNERDERNERGGEAIGTPGKGAPPAPAVQLKPASEAGGSPPAYMPALGTDPLALHAPAAAPVVQRKVVEGWHDPGGNAKKDQDSWNAGRTQVDSHGHAGRDGAAVPNAQTAAENVGVEKVKDKPDQALNQVTRIPLEGLTKCPSHRAIVVVPSDATLKGATGIDVLLHFHGAGNNVGDPSHGIEQKNRNDKKPAADAEMTHDLHLAKIPQQIAAYGGPIIAITVQQSKGGAADVQDGLVDEVFGHLQAQKILTADQKRGRTIVSGYSAGYSGAMAEAKEHEPGSGKIDETVRGLMLFDPYDGNKSGHQALKDLIDRRLGDDLAQLKSAAVAGDDVKTAAAQSNYLETNGYMVRVFAQAKFNTDTKALNDHIEKFFKNKAKGFPTDAAVRGRWRSNYQAIAQAGGSWDGHGVMEGDGQVEKTMSRDYDGDKHKGHLQQGLEDWGEQHKAHPAAPPPQQQQNPVPKE